MPVYVKDKVYDLLNEFHTIRISCKAKLFNRNQFDLKNQC